MGNVVAEKLGVLVAAFSGMGKAKDGPMAHASVMRQALGTLDQFPEDPDAVAAYTEGSQSHAGLSASSLPALLLHRALYAAMDQMEADIQAGICSPSADVVDLIVGENAIKDGKYRVCKWALYDLVHNGKLEGVPVPSSSQGVNALRPRRIVYFSVAEGSPLADTLTKLIGRAAEALPKSFSHIEVPEFEIRFVGIEAPAD